LLRHAGIKPRHVTRIIPVSRVTASNWLRGVSTPRQVTFRAIVDSLMQAARDAVDAKELPVPSDMPADEKSVRTLATLKRRMRAYPYN
jgi:hypothetical protein